MTLNPPSEVSVSRRRGQLVGQVLVVAVVVAVGTGWSYLRFRGVLRIYAPVLESGGVLLKQRQQLQRNELAQSDRVRLEQSRVFLEQLTKISENHWTALFMPASLLPQVEPPISGLVTRVVGDVVLGDIRAGLEHEGRAWLEATARAAADRSEPVGPDLTDNPRNPRYTALERFSEDYRRFVESYLVYGRLALGQGTGDLSSASILFAYLTGVPLGATALSPTMGRAVRAARSAPLDCRIFDEGSSHGSLEEEAGVLIRDFGDHYFHAVSQRQVAVPQSPGENPLLAAASASDVLPIFERPPFRPLPATIELCEALRLDLSVAIRDAARPKDRQARPLK